MRFGRGGEREREEIVRLWEIGGYAERVGFVFLFSGWDRGKVWGRKRSIEFVHVCK